MVKTGEENKRARKQTERQKQKNKRDGPKRSQKTDIWTVNKTKDR